MPKNPSADRRISPEEWSSVPEFFGTDVAARVWGVSRRYLLQHASELGGVNVGGKWTFSRSHVLGLFDRQAAGGEA